MLDTMTLKREGLACRACSDGAMSRIRAPQYLALHVDGTKAPFDGMITGRGRVRVVCTAASLSRGHGQRLNRGGEVTFNCIFIFAKREVLEAAPRSEEHAQSVCRNSKTERLCFDTL